jgi:peptidoglycan/xylan/chitin deacetylase (PgdA/CDA1 family)
MSKKEALARGMGLFGLHGVCTYVRHMLTTELPILAYHRVYDLDDESAFPFDPELVSASVTGFAWQMRYVKDRYQPITFQTLLDSLDGKATLPDRPLIITFDDGYDDNYHHAFPVLRGLSIPATVFISTGYIGRGKPFWFDLVAHIIYRAASGSVALEGLDMTLRLEDDVESRRVATARVVGALKRVRDQQRLTFLDWLEERYREVVNVEDFRRSRPLDWDQLREMSAAGIEIGSHTVSHPILSMLDDASLTRELVDSRHTLEHELGKPVSVLAYPVGGAQEFNDKVVEVAQATGYRLGVSYMQGVNRLGGLDPFRLRRQHVERYTTAPYFSAQLSLPELFR